MYNLTYMTHISSFIHSGYFYSASSSPLLLRSAPDKARILCRSITPKRHRQLWAKDLPKVLYEAAGAGFESATLSYEKRRIYQWVVTFSLQPYRTLSFR